MGNCGLWPSVIVWFTLLRTISRYFSTDKRESLINKILYVQDVYYTPLIWIYSYYNVKYAYFY